MFFFVIDFLFGFHYNKKKQYTQFFYTAAKQKTLHLLQLRTVHFTKKFIILTLYYYHELY